MSNLIILGRSFSTWLHYNLENGSKDCFRICLQPEKGAIFDLAWDHTSKHWLINISGTMSRDPISEINSMLNGKNIPIEEAQQIVDNYLIKLSELNVFR